jgi:hypothetical protein
MDQRPRSHVFVDFSNFWATLGQLRKDNNVEPRSIPESQYRDVLKTLRDTLFPRNTAGDALLPETRLAVGSVKSTEQVNQALWNHVRHDFNCNLYLRASSTQPAGAARGGGVPASGSSSQEVGVDVALHAQILRKICDVKENPRGPAHILVLLTGDGNNNQSGGGVPDGFVDPTTFPMCIDLALMNGWEVRLFAWEKSCSKSLKAFSGKPRFTLSYLDESEMRRFAYGDKATKTIEANESPSRALKVTCRGCGRGNHQDSQCNLSGHPDFNSDPTIEWIETDKAKKMQALVKYQLHKLPAHKCLDTAGTALVAWDGPADQPGRPGGAAAPETRPAEQSSSSLQDGSAKSPFQRVIISVQPTASQSSAVSKSVLLEAELPKCYGCGHSHKTQCRLVDHPDYNHNPNVAWIDTEKAKKMQLLVKYDISALPARKCLDPTGTLLTDWERS